MYVSRQVRLAKHPVGSPRREDFDIVECELLEPADGELLVESVLLSVDPYMRLRMRDPAFLGRGFGGNGIGRVIVSRNGNFDEGELVRHVAGLCDRFLTDGSNISKIDHPAGLPLETQLSAFGGIGLCAYGGLLETGRLRDGEEVFVSAAAGAVGSLAAQIAKIKNCHVVGSTSAEDKADWLRSLGIEVVNYRTHDIVEALTDATPRGIDVYFENVGGRHLDAALARMNIDGRIPVCGMISAYNSNASPVETLHEIIMKRVTIRGFQFTEFDHLLDRFRHDMADWLSSGAIRTQETIFEGLDAAPDALIAIFDSRNVGKTLLRLQHG